MAIRKIRIYGDEVLRKKAKVIKKFDKQLNKLVNDMFETMYSASGIGLASPQIGLLKRLIIIDTYEEGEKFAFANPKITWKSDESNVMKEGCLSIPGVEGEVRRSERIKIKANDPYTGEEVEKELSGLPARVFQHELDHLNGVLFIDHLTNDERMQLSRKLEELTAA